MGSLQVIKGKQIREHLSRMHHCALTLNCVLTTCDLIAYSLWWEV